MGSLRAQADICGSHCGVVRLHGFRGAAARPSGRRKGRRRSSRQLTLKRRALSSAGRRQMRISARLRPLTRTQQAQQSSAWRTSDCCIAAGKCCCAWQCTAHIPATPGSCHAPGVCSLMSQLHNNRWLPVDKVLRGQVCLKHQSLSARTLGNCGLRGSAFLGGTSSLLAA